MSEPDVRYWPFPTLPPERHTDRYQKQVRFLEEAFAAGFRPREDVRATLEGDYLAENDDGRYATILYRGAGGRRWEVGLGEHRDRVHAFWTDDFEAAAAAALVWLKGGTAADVSAAVAGRVIRGAVAVEPALTPRP